jgi:hypothetical protein
VPIHIIYRACDLVQEVGLALGEAKSILGQLQQTLVREQLEHYLTDRTSDPVLVAAIHKWFDAQVSDHGKDAIEGRRQ